MKKLEYTDEATFLTEQVEFNEKQYSIAKNLHKSYTRLSKNISPIMVGKDKKSLLFCINLDDRLVDRAAYENGDNIYRIIIEKI